MRITVEVSSKDRYDVLSQALLSLALQTHRDFDLILLDDTDNPIDLRELPAYQMVFHLFNRYGIGWQVVFGGRRGQHHNHQHAQEISKTDWVFRFDDDQILEPDVLGKLLGNVRENVGAVAGLVLPPEPLPVPNEAANLIADLDRPNIQWFTHSLKRVVEVEHLHSTFLYRRGIAKYELDLSPAAHREETLFTHAIKRAGYKLLVDTSAITWHFQSPRGGIRSHHDPGFWNHDENVFAQTLIDWGVVTPRPEKILVLDCGRGDHVIVKRLLPRIKAKYPDCLVATCFPDILNGEVPQISIHEARRNLGNLEKHSVYGWCIERNWTGNLVEAFETMYELE